MGGADGGTVGMWQTGSGAACWRLAEWLCLCLCEGSAGGGLWCCARQCETPRLRGRWAWASGKVCVSDEYEGEGGTEASVGCVA